MEPKHIRVEGPAASNPSRACSVAEFLVYLEWPWDRPGDDDRLSEGMRSAEVARSKAELGVLVLGGLELSRLDEA